MGSNNRLKDRNFQDSLMAEPNSVLGLTQLSVQKQNILAAEILKRDLNTFYYACSSCSRILLSKEKLRLHERVFHPVKSITPKVKTSKEHRQNVGHQPLATTISAVVKKKKSGKSIKKRHANTTGGNGDYCCKYCQSRFTSPWNLKVHLQTIHENIRPFSCSTCGKGFKQRIHLLGHFISTHSNVKPFKCELCPARFSKKWNLFDHVRKHHGGSETDLDQLKLKYSKRRKSSEMDD